MGSLLVTGSARGIGRATVLRLAAAGWDVYAGVRRAEDGEALVAAASDGGVAAMIERALTTKRPRARYVVGLGPRVQGVLARVTPDAAMDALLSTATGVPRKA